MKLRELFPKKRRSCACVLSGDSYSDAISCGDYTPLDRVPEIVTAVNRIAETVSMMTIYLMESGENGDIRLQNELSRKIDIQPNQWQNRKEFMEEIVRDMLLYGRGNALVLPHTKRGILTDLEPIQPHRWQLMGSTWDDFYYLIDGKRYENDEVLHFIYQPHPVQPWQGVGLQMCLRDLATALKQADSTKLAFLRSKWKPSVIVKVDSLTDEFSSPEGRERLLNDYVKSSTAGDPWLIPAEQFQVDTIKPLTLADLAISDTVEADKRTVAAILGVPPFLVGVGEYNANAWNNFVNTTIKSLSLTISQEMTRKLILSPKWYLKLNFMSLLDWDVQKMSSVYLAASDRGFVTGNEYRDKVLNLSPKEGLDELKVLENYIPYGMSALQSKLNGGD